MPKLWFAPRQASPAQDPLRTQSPATPSGAERTGHVGTRGTFPARTRTPIHPFAADGGLAEAQSQQEPAPLASAPGAIVGQPFETPAQFVPPKVRQPQLVASTNSFFPSAGTAFILPLIDARGTGIIRAVNVIVTALGINGSDPNDPCNFDIQSTYGEIYFPFALQVLTASPINQTLLNLQDLYVPFKNGLQVSGVSFGGTGRLNVIVVWEM